MQSATNFTIDTTIPSPSDGRRKDTVVSQALKALKVAPIGASIFFRREDIEIDTLRSMATRHMGKGCSTIRKSDGGYRIWRIA